MNYLSKINSINMDEPTILFEDNTHKIYWIGIEDNTAFRCNVYLIEDGEEFIIVDPGSRGFFQEAKKRVAQITEPENITGLILCHQDPRCSSIYNRLA